MSQRAGSPLRLFGYNQLGSGRSVTINQSGGIQDDYILGAGDEIVISLRGQENNELRVSVNRDGQVVLPRLNPIVAAGRSFGSFREDVEAAVRRAYVATNAFVSVGRLRQINVVVSGEVANPGQRTVSGLASVLDAILLSGGIQKTGSLRNIRLQRGAREYVIDLYGILTDRSGFSAMSLRDGDRIRVPLLGRTVAIVGPVRQPAIYELPSGQDSISIRALMALAGGEEVRGLYQLSVSRVQADGRIAMTAVTDDSGTVRDSEILFVRFAADQTINRATLSGGTGLAGSVPVTEGTKLSSLLKAPGAMGNSPYTLLGLVSRRDTKTLLRTLTAFTPVAVLNGNEDLAVQGDDIVRVISVEETNLIITVLNDYVTHRDNERDALHNPVAASVNPDRANNPLLNGIGANPIPANSLRDNAASGAQNSTYGTAGAILSSANAIQNSDRSQREESQAQAGRVILGSAGVSPTGAQNPTLGFLPSPAPIYGPAGNYPANREVTTFDQLSLQLGVDPLVLINFLLDHEVKVSGAIRGPGIYLVGPSVVLQDLLTAAGGPKNWTDASSVELISTAIDSGAGRSLTQLSHISLSPGVLTSYVVQPRDEFRFNEIFNDAELGSVTVQGEVRFAGTYRLTRGERLSDVLARAGGLTNVAYPYGTIFLRKSSALLEQESYVRLAAQAEDQLLVAMTRVGNDKIDPSTFTALQVFVNDLRNQKPLGRVAVQADPSLLAANPRLDPLMEGGDVIFVPPRPSTVSVFGQVMQPGSFPYRNGSQLDDYVEQAGGYSPLADGGNTFVILPDGSARKMERSWLRLDATSLPPGSAIIVPRNVTPLDLRQTVMDVTQILSQLAVTIASVAVLSK